jgi:hypothetical protein
MRGRVAAGKRSIRFDCGSWLSKLAGIFAARGSRRSRLEFYLHPTAGFGRDKRQSPRYQSTGTLQLRSVDGDPSLSVDSTLLDISRTGAQVLAAKGFRVGQRIIVTQQDSRQEIQAIICGIEDGDRLQRVRLTFNSPCPKSFLKAAIGGILSAKRAI